MRTRASLLLGVWFVVAPSLRAQTTALDSLRSAHAESETRVARLLSSREAALPWAEARYRVIPAARARGGGELREALRAAQVAADSLAALDLALAEALAVARQARRDFADALERELESVLIQAEFAAEQEAKTDLLGRARELAIELTDVQGPLELPAADIPQVTVEPGDGPEEIGLKADFLDDRAAQLRKAADVVTGVIEGRARRAELQAEMRRLVAEVRLFDQARVPPAGAGAGTETRAQEGNSPPPTAGDLGATPPSVVEEVPQLVRPLSDRGVDLPASAASGDQRGEGRDLVEQLHRLRAELLGRAASLEARADEIRAMLRGPP